MSETKVSKYSDSRINYFYYQDIESDIIPAGIYSCSIDSRGKGIFYPKEINPEPVYLCPDSLGDRLNKEINTFLGKQETYRKHGLPFKRGYLLHGDPGCGKSAIVRGLASKFAKENNGIILELNSYTRTCYKAIRSVEPDRVVMIVCEDLDSWAPDDDDTQILELLDGQSCIHNAIFIATTNKMNKMAKRLTSRPSRIDSVIKIEAPTSQERAFYLSTFKLDKKIHEELLERSGGFTFAQIKETVILCTVFSHSPEAACNKMRSLNNPSGKKAGFGATKNGEEE